MKYLSRFGIAAVTSTGLLFFMAAASQAEAVEYVKVCSLYGEGWAYIPGSDWCTNSLVSLSNDVITKCHQTISGTECVAEDTELKKETLKAQNLSISSSQKASQASPVQPSLSAYPRHRSMKGIRLALRAT
jgi:hypothetical protein